MQTHFVLFLSQFRSLKTVQPRAERRFLCGQDHTQAAGIPQYAVVGLPSSLPPHPPRTNEASKQIQAFVNAFGSYWQEQSGGGRFSDRCSPPSGRAASRILRSAGLSAAAELAETWSISTALEAAKKSPG